MNIKYTFLKIGLAIMFVICLADMPYGYFQLVRFLGMVVFFILAYDAYTRSSNPFAILWFASAVLINPFVKVALGRTIWNVVDVIWAVLLILSILLDKDQTLPNNLGKGENR